jgi:hypothetical protein
MSNQIKLMTGSIFAVATLILISTGSASAQDKGCMKTARSVQTQQQQNTSPSQSVQTQQPNSSPSQFSQPGYIRGTPFPLKERRKRYNY